MENITLAIPESAVINEIINIHKNGIGPLIPILQDIQNKFGYISEEALEIISEKLRQPIPHVYGVATFHSQFKLKMKGEEILQAEFSIKICSGSPCHVRGAKKIMEVIEKALGIKCGEISKDRVFSFEMVECLGACGISPAIAINDKIHGNLTPDSTENLLNKLKYQSEIKGIKKRAEEHKKHE
ncbi:MAG: NAD(P)H-dependent oxidoreductase subunit E [bacterium]